MSFKDTGIGIDKKDIDKLFKKFERIYDQKDIFGHGLGLAFIKNCVLAHDGEIFVKSEKDIGTEFIVIIPKSRFA